MTRKQQVRKHAAKGNRRLSTSDFQEDEFEPTVERPTRRVAIEPFKPMTEAQERYLRAIKSHLMVFGIGPAGTGKSHVAVAYAAQQLIEGLIDKIIVTRPAEETGGSMGFLPGELSEKYEPYLAPVRVLFHKRMGVSTYEYELNKSKRIEPSPLAFMRGSTFENCVVILDEAQNVDPKTMKMFLTRVGRNCKVIVNGDLDQQDISGPSGLADALDRVAFIPSVKVVEFQISDIVRSGLAQEIVEAYSKPVVGTYSQR